MCSSGEEGDLDEFKRIVNSKTVKINLANVNDGGKTPLHYAVVNSKTMVFVEFLIENGVELNAVDRLGDAALMKAAASEQTKALNCC